MKHIHRFFANERLSSGQTVRLSSNDAFHAARVLRLRPGDRLELADGEGRAFRAEVKQAGDEVAAVVGEEIPVQPDAEIELTVVQSMPKGKKMDLVVEKLSEIGVNSLIPVYTDGSVARPKPGGGEKLERWRRIARASAGQSRRTRVMEIAEPMALADWLASREGTLIVLATEIDSVPLGLAVENFQAPLALMAGPEAGFTKGEISLLQGSGAVFANLGSLVLRTETAALVATAIIMHRLGGLG